MHTQGLGEDVETLLNWRVKPARGHKEKKRKEKKRKTRVTTIFGLQTRIRMMDPISSPTAVIETENFVSVAGLDTVYKNLRSVFAYTFYEYRLGHVHCLENT
jgi:hypothetical protein